MDNESSNDTRDWSILPLVHGDGESESKVERIKNFMTPVLSYFSILDLTKNFPDNEMVNEMLIKEEALARRNLRYVSAILDTI